MILLLCLIVLNNIYKTYIMSLVGWNPQAWNSMQEKCTFATNKSVFLWHDVSRNATRPSSNRVDSIKNFPILSTIKELRCALGLLNWFRKYILHTDAIKTLKEALITSNVLSFPKFDLLFRIAEDTSSRGILYMIY